jgi:hypothetical protein
MSMSGDDQLRTGYHELNPKEAKQELEAPFSVVKGWLV